MSAEDAPRTCWCGHPKLEPYSDEYRVCRACGTLLSRAPASGEGTLYAGDYWYRRQTDHHGLPDIRSRARLDLPERCTHWLKHLLERRLPPARVLEVGCAHGGYSALLRWSGFEVTATEMSPAGIQLARELFGIDALAGPVETLDLPAASFDVIILNDVLEHLPRPLETIRACAALLSSDGFFVIQTPEYKEHLSHKDLVAAGDLFLKHMENNNDEHLYLFSRRSVGRLFAEVNLPVVDFLEPVYAYDQFLTASRAKLARNHEDAIVSALAAAPTGRLVLALLDKAAESRDRWWAIQRLEEKLPSS
jgi:2-polyprenyl-3-methyl-5-hydroxy-6-metoxy-1,4-benzoquinol methylase